MGVELGVTRELEVTSMVVSGYGVISSCVVISGPTLHKVSLTNDSPTGGVTPEFIERWEALAAVANLSVSMPEPEQC